MSQIDPRTCRLRAVVDQPAELCPRERCALGSPVSTPADGWCVICHPGLGVSRADLAGYRKEAE